VDFSATVLSGGETEWEYLTGSDRMQNQVGQMLLTSFISETNRIQATVMTLGVDPSMVTGDEAESSYVETGRLVAEGKDYTALQYYASSMLVMFLLYSGMTVAISIVREKESHRLSRLQSMPIHPNRIVTGKILGNMMLAVLQVLVIILVTGLAFGADWGDDWMALSLVCLTAILASMALGCFAAFVLRSTKAVGGVLGPFIGIMTFVSGGMNPTEGTVLEAARPFTVNYWASDSLVKIMMGQGSADVYGNVLVLLLIALVFILLAGYAYRKVGFHE
jgi:ABC-2 type transport system permease protein